MKQSLEAALASLHLVDDKTELSVLRRPLFNFRDSFQIAEFDEDSGQDKEFDFYGDSAYVITRTSQPQPEPVKGGQRRKQNKEPADVRKLLRTPERPRVPVASRRIEAAISIPFNQEFFRGEDMLSDIAKESPERLAGSYQENVLSHYLWLLRYVAEQEPGRSQRINFSDLVPTVREAVSDLAGKVTIFAGAEITSELARADRNFDDDRMQFGPNARIHLTRLVPEGVGLIVAHRPREVGIIRIRFLPELFTTTRNGTDGVAMAVGECGFCVWGDAPIRVVQTDANRT